MSFIDFATLKERIPIEDAIPMLSLDLKQRGRQWRGPCPACQAGSDRALVITPDKHAFYCFGGKTGGDVIALVAHIRDCGMKQAADYLARNSTVPMGNSTSSRNSTSSTTVPEERSKEAARSLRPLTYLQPEHKVVQALGLGKETCAAFGAGYAPKGIMRGRFAIPVHDWQGRLLAYCGQAVTSDQQPELIFPNGFQPDEPIFNAHRIGAGESEAHRELVLARGPLEALKAYQAGIDNVVSFLTETISAEQLQRLAALMDETGCDTLELP